ncbi:MAG: hypothetical protein HYR91_06715 [Flavobacteriia bacterium]|nr:hypothetical protein [Flavobacteriia bacterium]
MSAFDRLLSQIDAFIRKYYKNEMIKGLFLFGIIFLFSFLLTTTLEFFGRFNSVVRAILFFGFILTNIYVLAKYIIIPVSRLFALGKQIDRYQASKIIGSFFPSISDRLLNTLQLNDNLTQNEGNFELIRASVSQRSASLTAIPFTTAIDIKENKRYLKYIIPLLLIFLAVGIFVPTLFQQGTERVVNYSQEFKPIAPFDFVLNNTDLEVEEGDDLEINLILKGSQFPDKIYLVSSQGKFLMEKSAKNAAHGFLKKIKENDQFYFEGNSFESTIYPIHVIKKSTIGKLEARLVYPSYLGKQPETIINSGDLAIPEGTFVEWNIITKNTQKVVFDINSKSTVYEDESFRIKQKFLNDARIRIAMFNSQNNKKDTASFFITVAKDGFPSIHVDEIKDSISESIRFFSGSIADDYGFTSLKFVYTIISENGKKRTQSIPVGKVLGTEMPFNFAVDFKHEDVKLNDKIEYYFIVNDNDGVNGSKSSRSQTFEYKLPSLEELNEKRFEDQLESKENLKDILTKANDFQKKVDHLKKDILNSKSNDFNKINQVQQLQQEQQNIQKSLEQMLQQIEESTEQKNQLSEMDKELLEKQQMIEDLLNEVMDDELMELLKKLEDLLKQDNNEKLEKQMEDVEQSSEDMKKQLDRSLEMLKKLQVNEKIDDLEKELKELSKEQNELKEKIDNERLNSESAKPKQDQLNEKFEELKEDLDELKKLNEELKSPMNLGDQEEMKKEISEEMKKASENLNNKKGKKASENQKKAADEMKKMADELDQMQQESNKEQQEEDINTLRSILKNLMTLSFAQEDVMYKFTNVKDNDPSYRKYGRVQRNIIDDTKVIKDSLEALAQRQPKIASFIDKELNDIEKNFGLALEDIDEHRKRYLNTHQQSVMTSYNNLALLLNESLESMQQQMQSESKGGGSCSKPGGKGKGKPKSGDSMNPGDMKEMLKKQLEQMQKGPNPGGDKPGDKPGSKPGQGGNMGMPGLGNKEIAKMAAQQTAIRQRLEQLKNELNKDGKGTGNKLNPLINELEKQEKDLINKNFSPEMIKRQKDILTRLLESEKALMERGFEEKRESKEGKSVNNSNQIRFDEYTKQKLKQIELLRSVDPLYRKYYKDKANEYFNRAN